MRRLLIVDDEKQMVRTLSDIVRLHGWESDGAFSGEAAVRAVREHAYDAVLMDVRMTGINGVEAFKEMKSIRPGIRVILMTAYTAADIIAEAEREGALRVLAKPVVLSGLLEMLDQSAKDARAVLVVADDVAFLNGLRALLEREGYLALEARNLNQALAALEARSPPAVVLDLLLDGISPKEYVVAIKRVSPGVALILCNGLPGSRNGNGQSVEPKLIHASLQKPFPPGRLIEILDDIYAS
jgi:DNA-binding NtrC family response regulator